MWPAPCRPLNATTNGRFGDRQVVAVSRVTPSHTGTVSRDRVSISAYGCRADVGLDVREGAPAVPAREGAHEPRRAVELDPGVAARLRPREPAGVPLHEGLGVGCEVEVFIETGIGLADLGLP